MDSKPGLGLSSRGQQVFTPIVQAVQTVQTVQAVQAVQTPSFILPRDRGGGEIFGIFRAMSGDLNGLNSLNDLNHRSLPALLELRSSVTACHAFFSYRE